MLFVCRISENFKRESFVWICIKLVFSPWSAGSNHCEAYRVWERCPLLWEKERGGWTHTPVVCLREALQKWGQTPRSQHSSSSLTNCNKLKRWSPATANVRLEVFFFLNKICECITLFFQDMSAYVKKIQFKLHESYGNPLRGEQAFTQQVWKYVKCKGEKKQKKTW